MLNSNNQQSQVNPPAGGQMLHVVLRTCTRVSALNEKQVGSKRPFTDSKRELVLTCLNSLLNSLDDKGTLHIVDDHSPEEDVQAIKKLLTHYDSRHRFISLEKRGNGNSVRKALEYARDQNFPLIYFCEDDYLHLPHAIASMLSGHEKQKAIIHPVDYFDRYVNNNPEKNIYPSIIYTGEYNYWRSIRHSTFTVLVSNTILKKHWDTYMRLADVTETFNGSGGEDETINTIYTTELCISPLPSLTAHLSPQLQLPPFILWKKIFEENKKQVQTILSKESVVEQKKPHVLFVVEEPSFGAWYFTYNMWGSLEPENIATHNRFHHDSFYTQHGKSGDEELIRQCAIKKPDLIVLRIFYFDGIKGPTPQTLLYLRRTLHIPMVIIYPDSDLVHESFIQNLSSLGIVSVMHDSAVHKAKAPSGMVLPLWPPYDRRMFNDPHKKRDIDVSFIGTIEGSHKDRKEMIELVRSAGISVKTMGSNLEKDKKIPIEQYIDALQRTKISLNFSKSGSGLYQMKGRVIETMLCGAMLLEQQGTETSRLFKDNEDYISFTDADDLIKKIRYYLEHEEERQKIAESGNRTSLQKYSPKAFWEAIFKHVGIL